MSWSVYADGTKQGVTDYVREMKCSQDADRVTFELVKDILTGEIQKVSTNGVHIEASGHLNQWTHMRVTGVHLWGT